MEHHKTNLTKNQFGLIGKTLSHSFSSDYHNRRFQREGIAARYSNFELNLISEIKGLVAGLPALKGLNVTVPFKESVIPFLDDVNAQAMAIGAVNTIVVEADRLIGYNTDVFGFEESLRNWIDGDLNGALVLGTGGASRAVGQALSNMGIRYVTVSRTRDENSISYEDITAELVSTHELIINATPLGMHPFVTQMPAIPDQYLTKKNWVYDLVYNPEKSILLSKSEHLGARIKNGLEMLHLQADKSWDIWKCNLE